MATRLCDEVSVAGFGYDVTKPLHYYDKLQMKVGYFVINDFNKPGEANFSYLNVNVPLSKYGM